MELVGELIDDVLFLSELETGRAVVALNAIRVLPVLREVVAEHAESAARAGVRLRVEGDAELELAIRPRMLKVVGENLTQNAIRYAGPGSAFTLWVGRDGDAIVIGGRTTGSACSSTISCACSSASTAPTGLGPRAAPVSGSRL